MKLIRTFVIGGLLFLISAFVPTMASAIPTANVLYLETDLGNGIWQYSYTVYNNLDSEFGLFDILFEFDPSVVLAESSSPNGWTENFENLGEGFAAFQSSFAGLPPGGYDIAPGDSLGEFVLQFTQQLVSSLAFTAAFWDYDSDAFASSYHDTTTPVPEPATLLLMMSGLAGIGVIGRKRIT